jgi:hypothetical protein
MISTKTASAGVAHIQALCRQISPDREPVELPIRPEPDAESRNCFHNVKRKVQSEGGRIQFGWAIWEWRGVYIEAEHHAVYEPPSGAPWVDITPSEMPEITRRPFLPDDTATYDYDNEGILRDNHRVALSDDPLIEAFFSSAREKLLIMNSIPGVGAVSVDPMTAARLTAVTRRQEQQVFHLAMKYTPQGARCFCGSGAKFKRCHGETRGRQ